MQGDTVNGSLPGAEIGAGVDLTEVGDLNVPPGRIEGQVRHVVAMGQGIRPAPGDRPRGTTRKQEQECGQPDPKTHVLAQGSNPAASKQR